MKLWNIGSGYDPRSELKGWVNFEINKELCEKQGAEGYEMRNCDVRKGLPNDSPDYVLCNQVLNEMTYGEAMSLARDIQTKKPKAVLFSVPDCRKVFSKVMQGQMDLAQAEYFLTGSPSRAVGRPSFFDIQRIEGLLRNAGFAYVEQVLDDEWEQAWGIVILAMPEVTGSWRRIRDEFWALLEFGVGDDGWFTRLP